MRASRFSLVSLFALLSVIQCHAADKDEDRHSHIPEDVIAEIPEPVFVLVEDEPNDEDRHSQTSEPVVAIPPTQPPVAVIIGDEVATLPPTTLCSTYQFNGDDEETTFEDNISPLVVDYQYEMEYMSDANSEELISELENALNDLVLQTVLPGICGSTERARFLRGLKNDSLEGTLSGISSSPLDQEDTENSCNAEATNTECQIYKGGLTLYVSSENEEESQIIEYIQSIIQSGMDDESLSNDIALIERLASFIPPVIPPINEEPTSPPDTEEEINSIPAFVWAMASATAVGVLGVGAFLRQRKTRPLEDDHAFSPSASLSNYSPVSSRFPLALADDKGYFVRDNGLSVEVEDRRRLDSGSSQESK